MSTRRLTRLVLPAQQGTRQAVPEISDEWSHSLTSTDLCSTVTAAGSGWVTNSASAWSAPSTFNSRQVFWLSAMPCWSALGFPLL